MERGGPNKGMLKLDFGNAFNRVSREHALREVRERFPEVARWTQWCYAKPSVLQLGDHSLWSAAGVQQGDPLGPLLFAAALHPVVAGLSDLTVDGASLDMNAFFLDDGFLAGDLPVVAAALQRLLAEAAERGLELNLAKCTLVLPADAAPQDLSALFPADLLSDPTSGESRVSTGGNFDILKAAIGDQAHCEAFAEDRVTAAGELMRLLPGIGNPQVALRLLRHCGSYCKVVHNMRTTPPDHQLDALQRFDTEVRETFGLMTGLAPTDSEWDQAARGMAHAGLALRQTALHAPAAYMASLGASSDLARALDAEFSTDTPHMARALTAYNNLVPEPQRLSAEAALVAKRRDLSAAVDHAGHETRLSTACMEDQATLRSECEPGARALWQAVPNRALGLAMEPAEFVAEIRQRLCMQECADDRWCPLCDAVMDRKVRHPRMCAAGGDRTLRHHSVRNFVYRRAVAAGLHPELEKPGLLIPLAPGENTRAQNRRRPADLYLPAWVGGSPAALDFAVTAPQRQGTLARAAETALAAATDYSDRKREHQGTDDLCRAVGVTFVPMVAETTGAWAPEAMAVFRHIASATSAASGRDARDILQEILEGAAVCIRRANARAELRRARDEVGDSCGALHAARAVIAASAP